MGNEFFQHVAGDSLEPVALPFADGAFDLVFSIGVLEHVHETRGDQAASLCEIARVLKPGGRFLCFHLPNKYSLTEALARNFFSKGRYHHTKLFSRTDVEALCAQARLKLLRWGGYNFLPRNSTRNLPDFIKKNMFCTYLFEGVDLALVKLLPWFRTQNYFIAVKD